MTVNRTPKTPASPETVTPTIEATPELQEEIRRRAYELYEQRGREGGRDLDDWLQAESEVAQSKMMARAA